MTIRRTSITVMVVVVLLLVAVPVGAAPSLQKGNHASYNLSASISFLQSCGPIGVSTSSSTIVCPMIASVPSTIDINGTLDYIVTDLNSTTASLNVTRNLAISNGDPTAPVAHSSGSFNESINLATRLINLLPSIMPEIDQVLQMAQTSMTSSLPTGFNWSGSMPMIDSTMVQRPLYTMWWVNGPLKLNQTIPVLALPTNVTGTSNLDLGGAIGTRTAWTLVFNLSRPLISPDPVPTSSSIPVGENFEMAFAFNYDQTSDLLLGASATVHFGFGEETTIQPNPCVSSTSSTPCPATTSPTVIMREFGFDIQASMKLASTTVDLNQRMTTTISPPDASDGSQSGMGSGSDSGSGSNPGTNTGSDSTSSTGATNSGTGQPASNSGQPKSSLQSAGWLPWIYGVLGIVAAVVIGSSVWVARRRMKRTLPSAVPTQSSV